MCRSLAEIWAEEDRAREKVEEARWEEDGRQERLVERWEEEDRSREKGERDWECLVEKRKNANTTWARLRK